MRKLVLIAIICGAALTAASSLQAAVYYFTPSQPDMQDLDHRYYKSWGIDWSAHTNETISGATLTIKNVYDWQVEPDNLYIHLLDDPNPGVKTFWDNQLGGDNWAGAGPLLANWTDPAGGAPTGYDLVIELNADQLAALNAYAIDGNFGFGFDPDCHYFNDGIELKITTGGSPVPEPASMTLLGLGLAGLGLLRRKK